MIRTVYLSIALLAWPVMSAIAQDETPRVAEADATPQAAPPATAREGDMTTDGTKIVCRHYKVTGTRFKRKDCKSEAAWEAFDDFTRANAKEATDRIQRNGCSGEPGRCY